MLSVKSVFNNSPLNLNWLKTDLDHFVIGQESTFYPRRFRLTIQPVAKNNPDNFFCTCANFLSHPDTLAILSSCKKQKSFEPQRHRVHKGKEKLFFVPLWFKAFIFFATLEGEDQWLTVDSRK